MSNQDQIDYWNGEAGTVWARKADTFDLMFAHFGAEMLSRAKLAPGECVLDIGCGSGATSFPAQDQIGATGQVTGLDVSLPLVMLARQRALKLNSQARFIECDAASWSNGSLFDVIISRFGVMFFEDPEKAFANLRKLTKPDGRLSFVCWRTAEEIEFVTLPINVVTSLTGETMPLPDPTAPGAHAFGDSARIHSILSAAGWREISTEAWDGTVDVPGTTALQGASFMAGMGGLARLVREKKIDKDRLIDALSTALEQCMENGKTVLKSPVWFVTARR